MSITLSEADLSDLEAALSLFLSPLKFERLTDWRRACRTRVERLIGADRSTFGLFMDGQPIGEQHADLDGAIGEYLAHYGALDVGFRDRRRALGVEIYTRVMLYGPEHPHSEFYNDWIVPHGLDDCVGIGIGTSARGVPEAFLNFYHAAESGRRFGPRETTLLRLLLPAFKAGMHTCRAVGPQPDRWVDVLDGIDQPAMLTTSRGVIYRTRALQQLLDGDPEQSVLLRAVVQMAEAIARVGRRGAKSTTECRPDAVHRELATSRARYHLRGGFISEESGSRAVVVAVDRLTQDPPTDAQLFARFRLTPRESQIARLLGAGRSNQTIAATLGISPHTVQHHTERVLEKLDLHARAGVAAALSRA